jgi:DNA-binding transcriptional ArsR family regulator
MSGMPTGTGIELLPIFRTDAQWAVLSTLFVTQPGSELPVAELARRGRVSKAAAQREVERLVTAGLLTERRDGRNRLVAANLDHPAARALRTLLALTAGPLHALTALYDIAGIDTVLIHGSWARRYHGEPGPFPHDIDAIAIGNDIDDIDARLAVQTINTDLGVDIHLEIVTPDAWADPEPGSVLAAIKIAPFQEVPH